MKRKLKIAKVNISDDKKLETTMWLYRLIEKIIIDKITTDPYIQGLLLSNSMKEFDEIIIEKEKDNSEKSINPE
ncbi:hypothetical protein [Aquibacillus albus]|uniref:Uncharacterized protein n=1 Tax=Aquibacillus albus TaxID=1168171 RepID=A0ABS2N086_9BACI|nr:hypothetical protein [Aquibacillus albus]MBM7571569.1 hypothetical protein [Aquibacillus albus]